MSIGIENSNGIKVTSHAYLSGVKQWWPLERARVKNDPKKYGCLKYWSGKNRHSIEDRYI